MRSEPPGCFLPGIGVRHSRLGGVNTAARVPEVACGGEVLATAALRDEGGDIPGVSFGVLRDLASAKGSDEPVRFSLIGRA